MNAANPESFAKIIYFKEFINPKTKQVIYKTVVMLKTYTGITYVGVESLYMSTGYPSFELLSYIVDSNLKNVKRVLNDETISD